MEVMVHKHAQAGEKLDMYQRMYKSRTQNRETGEECQQKYKKRESERERKPEKVEKTRLYGQGIIA